MSIFRNLFRKKAKLPAYESHVRSYVDQYESKPMYTIVDLGLMDLAERELYSIYIAVILPIVLNPGLEPPLSEEELGALHALEADTIVDAQRIGYLYAGHAIVTAAEHMYIAFYCRPEDEQFVTDSLNKICVRHGRQPTRVLVKEDQGWTFFTDRLAPDDYQMQLINHTDILQELKDHGDDGTAARPVYFWLYFKTREDAESAATKAVEEGYEQKELIDESAGQEPPADPEHPFALQLTASVTPTLDELNTRAWRLIDIAREHNGQYDGTETDVIKPGMEPPAGPPQEDIE